MTGHSTSPFTSQTEPKVLPSSSTNDLAKTDEAKPASTKDEEDEDANGDVKLPPVDSGLKEAKRILVDLISLWSRANSLAVTN